jgi:hypothetical protein
VKRLSKRLTSPTSQDRTRSGCGTLESAMACGMAVGAATRAHKKKRCLIYLSRNKRCRRGSPAPTPTATQTCINAAFFLSQHPTQRHRTAHRGTRPAASTGQYRRTSGPHAEDRAALDGTINAPEHLRIPSISSGSSHRCAAACSLCTSCLALACRWGSSGRHGVGETWEIWLEERLLTKGPKNSRGPCRAPRALLRRQGCAARRGARQVP